MVEKEKGEKSTEDVLVTVTELIDLYWEYLLVYPQNTLRITDSFANTKAIYSIQRFFGERPGEMSAYYIKSESVYSGDRVETVELKLIPSQYLDGKMTVSYTDSKICFAKDKEIKMSDLPDVVPDANARLERLQLNLLTLMLKKCRQQTLYETDFPKRLKEIMIEAYGLQQANEMWRAGMDVSN